MGEVDERIEAATLSVTEAAQVLGIGRGLAYELIRHERWPTPVLRLGRMIRIPAAPLEAIVGAPILVHSPGLNAGQAAGSSVALPGEVASR